MSVRLPPPLDQLVAAINGGDTEGFLALFSDKGAVVDWGRRFAGRAAIRKWSDKEWSKYGQGEISPNTNSIPAACRSSS